ncbi:MaoC family dehydratase [Dactylosporangium sp. CA-092794]|uniref:MaoC family dehydratase n=1 Tax=Dactylosporangium sp. CA-092794 TaxID=3239929 RepID=UPI003D8C28B6
MDTFERETHGRYLEEFEIGEVIHHWPGRTITSWENQQFTLLTGNSSSGHLDVIDAQEHGHRDMLVNGGYIVALVHGLSTRMLSSSPKAVVFVGMTDVRIMKPTYPGDTVRVFSKVLDKRESASKSDRGIVTVETWGMNQRGERIVEFKRVIMVWRQGHGPGTQQPVFGPEQ